MKLPRFIINHRRKRRARSKRVRRAVKLQLRKGATYVD